MKKFALLTLFAYLSIAFAPLGFAFDFSDPNIWKDDSNKCPGYVENKLELITTDEDTDEIEFGDAPEEAPEGEEAPPEEELTDEELEARRDEIDEDYNNNFTPYKESGLTDEAENKLELRDNKMAANRDEGKSICGEANNTTEYLEKGDCTASGAVVSEISEIIGPAIEDDGEGNQIIDVYKGICCLIVNTKDGEYQSCKEKRSTYSLTKDLCEEFSPFCEKRQWIISKSGVGIIKVYVKQLYIWAAGTIGLISVVTLVISGIQISVSGVSGDITAAKDRIMKVFVGLILLFFSGIILYTINPTFFS